MPGKTGERVLKFPPVAASVTDSHTEEPPDEGLVRALGLGSGVLFVLGSVIGSGIFLTTAGRAGGLPSPPPIHAGRLTSGGSTRRRGRPPRRMGCVYPPPGARYIWLH